MNFSSNLIFLRKKYNMTQSDLGKKLNVSRKAVSSWENERSYPDIKTLLSISDLYEISINDLFNEDIRLINRNTKSNNIKTKNMSLNNISYYLNIIILAFVYLNLLNPFKIVVPYLSLILIFNFIIWSVTYTNWKSLKLIIKNKSVYLIILYIINLNIIVSTNSDITSNLYSLFSNSYLIEIVIASIICSFILSYGVFIFIYGKIKNRLIRI